jgi:predicted regulator of Ras-like GTPase activity (Roadblock/LC7/MglB family)
LRASELRNVLAELGTVDHVVGALVVTPDGLVITSTLPGSFPVESLAALTATLGRELEVGAERLGRGVFRTAAFAAAGGSLYMGSTRLGFLIVVGQDGIDPARARTALLHAVTRLGPAVRPA